MKKTLIKYSVTAAIGLSFAAIIIWLKDLPSAETLADKYLILCDAFTVPGILIILVSALLWISNEGGFVGLGYIGRNLKRTLLPMGRTKYPHETYGDYLKEKAGKPKLTGYAFIPITGCAIFAVGLVFLILFYNAI